MQEKSTESSAGDRLRMSIEGRGWSLANFSRLSGVPYRSLQDYVAGKSKPGFDQLAKFADKGLDVNYILTGKANDIENNSLPDMIDLGSFQVGRHPFRVVEVAPILDKVADGFTLRDWIEVWDLANSNVPEAGFLETEERRRQGAVIFIASGIVFGLVERMRVIGWLSR